MPADTDKTAGTQEESARRRIREYADTLPMVCVHPDEHGVPEGGRAFKGARMTVYCPVCLRLYGAPGIEQRLSA